MDSGKEQKSKDAKTKSVQKVKISKKALRQAEQDLQQLMFDKRKMEIELAGIERSIYDQETLYLSTSLSDGNIIRGFGTQSSVRSERKKDSERLFGDNRIFSKSSISFKKRIDVTKTPSASRVVSSAGYLGENINKSSFLTKNNETPSHQKKNSGIGITPLNSTTSTTKNKQSKQSPTDTDPNYNSLFGINSNTTKTKKIKLAVEPS
ncbi:hypothetical protein BB559_002012 [Furculomyces boomerangus]|uniref:Chromatin modification-related protein EAF6 n=2 Tax=Harpellales TaxID=61421 RepID=A0A2T9YBV8_9FUNG|nr:hypothetical protein BB559_004914 [Furculomyces boomerangus]PVU97524.1 hypothetical protein BB559_002012 [Furculomyces boomerangus]PWA01973.1 hypothetical protein BB558_001904 [Smittium angustum]